MPDGRITVSAEFDYQITVDAAELTLKDLRMKFEKFPCAPNEEYVARYYDSNLDNFVDVQTDEALALMWGKHLASRTVLMSVHIVNKESMQETIVNDFGQLWTDIAKLSSIEELLLEYDAEVISEQEGIEFGEDDYLF